MSQLSQGNHILERATLLAIGAIHMLDEAGVTVKSMAIEGGKPVLTIDKPPAFVRGALNMSRPVDGGAAREARLAAPYRGCQLVWLERREATQGRRAAP